MIYTVIKRRYDVRLKKADLDLILYSTPNLKKDVRLMENELIKSKRIKLKEYRSFNNYISRFISQYFNR